MISNEVVKAIDALDLEPIKRKLMHASHGEGWSQARANAIAIEYRRFLYLQHAYPGKPTSPTADVDTFWHYHILDTVKYAADCDRAFGYFLHHHPYLGLSDDAPQDEATAAAQRTREIYEATFGVPYLSVEAYGEGAEQAHAAKCQVCIVARPAPGQQARQEVRPC